ncbi:PucR family transcriptional regulator [Marinicrinis sediminis]|uniref:PucR family transcriptional regulator n=1 Tax=Marinicrinis sediminis TaxID=1652465 RepID=A0ABW5R7M1_9BACL
MATTLHQGWKQLAHQLENVFGHAVEVVLWPRTDWENHPADSPNQAFLLAEQAEHVSVLLIHDHTLSHHEFSLVHMLIDLAQASGPVDPGHGANDSQEEQMRDWLLQQWNMGHMDAEMPEEWVKKYQLNEPRIPMLLQAAVDVPPEREDELRKLLESFFEENLLVIALPHREWLLLAPETVLYTEDDEEGEPEPREEVLTNLCLGLHEMLATEWISEVVVSVDLPIPPHRMLVKALHHVKETLALGRHFQPEQFIYVPWQLHLERLLESIPEPAKQHYMDQVFTHMHVQMDAETALTLEQFFQLDCNVSETAKKLYIHRNTLIYRLDKFKQETGLDVRKFHDAVLVKIAMLLYKVTKRP